MSAQGKDSPWFKLIARARLTDLERRELQRRLDKAAEPRSTMPAATLADTSARAAVG